MRESPQTAANYHYSKMGVSKSLINIYNIKTLRNKGVLVIDNVLSDEEIKEVRNEINILVERSQLFESNGHSDVETRTDSVFWVTDPDSTGLNHLSVMRDGVNPGLLRAIRCIRSIPNELTAFGYDSDEMGVPLSNQVVLLIGLCAH